MANRPRRFLLYSFAAVLPAIGLLAGTAAVAGASTTSARPAAHSAAAEAKAIAVSEIKKLTVGYHDTDHSVAWRTMHSAFHDQTAQAIQPRHSIEFRTVAYFE